MQKKVNATSVVISPQRLRSCRQTLVTTSFWWRLCWRSRQSICCRTATCWCRACRDCSIRMCPGIARIWLFIYGTKWMAYFPAGVTSEITLVSDWLTHYTLFSNSGYFPIDVLFLQVYLWLHSFKLIVSSINTCVLKAVFYKYSLLCFDAIGFCGIWALHTKRKTFV